MLWVVGLFVLGVLGLTFALMRSAALADERYERLTEQVRRDYREGEGEEVTDE